MCLDVFLHTLRSYRLCGKLSIHFRNCTIYYCVARGIYYNVTCRVRVCETVSMRVGVHVCVCVCVGVCAHSRQSN